MLKPALKGGIAWRRHDFLSGPPHPASTLSSSGTIF